MLSKVLKGWPLVYARLAVLLLGLIAVPLQAANLATERELFKPYPKARGIVVHLRGSHDVAEVAQISAWLRTNGGNPLYIQRVAKAVHRYSRELNLDPLLVVGVIGVENKVLKPTAKSSAGARGIMQVMPLWSRVYARHCGYSITDIETNVCMGTRILKLNIEGTSDLRSALLRYNGCVRSPGCGRYSTNVLASVGRAALLSERIVPDTLSTYPRRPE